MSGLFGRGGGSPDESNTGPTPLNSEGDKTDIIKTLLKKTSNKLIGPSINDSSDSYPKTYQDTRSSMASSYQSTGPSSRGRVNTVDDFSDMSTADNLRDTDISELRKDGYKLSNLEKEFDIRHKNDFSNIIKIILVTFSILIGLGFLLIIGIITWTSYKTNTMTETGIISNFLQFIAEIIKIGLS